MHSILKQQPADNQQGNHSAVNLQNGGVSASPLFSKDYRERCYGAALQLLLFYMETGQMSGCFGSAGGKLFVANHCEETAEVIKNLSLVIQSFHFYKNIFAGNHLIIHDVVHIHINCDAEPCFSLDLLLICFCRAPGRQRLQNK